MGIIIALQDKGNFPAAGGLMSSDTSDSVLTSDEAIQYLRISKPTFLKYIRLGRIKAIKAGKGWRVLHSELYRFLKEGSDEASMPMDSNENQTPHYPDKDLLE